MEIELHDMDLPALLEAVRYGAIRTIGRDRAALQSVAFQIECEIERIKETNPLPDPIHRIPTGGNFLPGFGSIRRPE